MQTAAAGIATGWTAARALGDPAEVAAAEAKGADMIWGNLLHLGFNMWGDWDKPELRANYTTPSDTLRFDSDLWDEIIDRMVEKGMNLVVIDLGEGVVYDSHPELAVEGSWSPARLTEELEKLRAKGIEPIPKLNFSATHDHWLGPYSRAVSTDAYYAVCRDLIEEVASLFGKPRFFHLGMDEETAEHQRNYEYVVIRQHDLWWRDFLFLVEQTEKAGCRPWIWSDYILDHRDEFLRRMPKSVVQSNWYYGTDFDPDKSDPKAYVVKVTEAFQVLADAGYDQIPTGSNWSSPDNFGLLVEYCAERIPEERLLGFLQTPWKPTLPDCRTRHFEAIDQVAAAAEKLRAKQGEA